MPIIELREKTINRAFVFTAMIAALINFLSLKLNKQFENSKWEVIIFFVSNIVVLYTMRFVFGYGNSMRV